MVLMMKLLDIGTVVNGNVGNIGQHVDDDVARNDQQE